MTRRERITLEAPEGFDDQGFRNFVQRAKMSGFVAKGADPDLKHFSAAQSIGSAFLLFLVQTLQMIGLMDESGIITTRGIVRFETPDGVTDHYEQMRYAWSERAKDWAAVESPATYAATMETLAQFVRLLGKPETVLSLGSGPGLYEIFLGALLRDDPKMNKARIICTDYAEGMVNRCQELLHTLTFPDQFGPTLLTNVSAQVEDMTRLSFADGSVSQIICNNSLQWASDWRRAVAEMARVIDPQGMRMLYIFINNHPMRVCDHRGNLVFKSGDFTAEELMDELESHNFQPLRTRQFMGRQGTGQAGGSMNRMFLMARFEPDGVITPWREARHTATITCR